MINEIFRFAVVRAPKLEPSQTDRTIRVIEWVKEDTPYYEHLKAQVQAGENRLAIAEAAQSYLIEQGINLEFSGFQWPIIPFARWLFAQDAERSATMVLSQVNSLFGTGIHELLDDPTFQADQQKLASGLIAASTLLSGMEPLRSRLIQGLKAVKLLMAISREEVTGKRAIREILDYAVLLPGDVFPLPDPQAQRKAQLEEEREKQQAAFLKQTARVAALLETYTKQQAAIEELSQSYHKMRQLQSAENLNLSAQTVQTQPVQTVRVYDGFIQKAAKFLGIAPVQKWKTPPTSVSLQVLAPKDILGASYIEQLSASTKGVLQQLETTGEGVDVPVVITQLQAANAQIAAELGNFNTVLPGIPLPPDLITEPHDFVSGVLGACAPTSAPGTQQEQQPFVPDSYGKVHKIGIADLMIVRQKLLGYEAEEIVHIENILKGEDKEREHRRLQRTEETTIEEVETEQEQELDLQSSEQFELQKETNDTIYSDRSLEAGVTVNASWGAVETSAFGNFASSRSEENSKSTASNFARDVTSRSVQRIKERVLNRRTRTTLEEVEIVNTHEVDNTNGTEHVVGIYRAVNKLYEAQIINYGKRTVLEFLIPEPAAFYKFAQTIQPPDSPLPEKPDRPGYCLAGNFHPLKPTDLTEANYLIWAGRYGVLDLEPPPKRYLTVGLPFEAKRSESEGVFPFLLKTSKELKIPAGYLAIAGYVNGDIGAYRSEDWANAARLRIYIGRQQSIISLDTDSYQLKITNPIVYLNGEEDTLPVSITCFNGLAYAFNLEVRCERSLESFQQWQIDTYNAIMSAYNELLAQYRDEVEAQEIRQGVSIQGRNPLLNRETERTELRKLALAQLTGQNYELFHAVSTQNDPNHHYPEVDLTTDDAFEEGRYIQFFETALEWRLMTYLFYPYFWGNKASWPETLQIRDNDPLFEKFLQAGAVRVQVPVRPGFERALCSYIEGGVMVGERDEDACIDNENQSLFLSMLDELKEQLNNDFVDRDGTLSLTKDSRIVLGTGTDFKQEDQDRELLIDLEVYRIAEVLSPTEIRLRKPYEGTSVTEQAFAVGAKLVGEPWVVKVPTNLVHLQKSGELS